jgi:hypothetical protein
MRLELGFEILVAWHRACHFNLYSDVLQIRNADLPAEGFK